MNKDKALEELFLAQKPQFSDSNDFMTSLVKRLDAVEFIKQHQEATIRRYKMAIVAAFVVGVISGAITIAYVLSMPSELPLLHSDDFAILPQLQTGFLLWFAENYRIITATVLAFLMSLGIISIISNIQDILQMRVHLKATIKN